MIKNPKHKFRSYFRETKISTDDRRAIKEFFNNFCDLEEILKFGSGFPLGCIIDFDIDSFLKNYGLVPKINSETLFKKIIKYKNFNENIFSQFQSFLFKKYLFCCR